LFSVCFAVDDDKYIWNYHLSVISESFWLLLSETANYVECGFWSTAGLMRSVSYPWPQLHLNVIVL